MRILSTKRTQLREFVPADADSLMAIFGDVAAMQFAPMEVTQDRSVAASAIEWHIENYRRFGYGAWAVIGRGEAFVGLAGLLPHDVGTELFFSIVPAFWGRGFATEVASGCRDYAFGRLGIQRLISIIHPDHPRAVAVARKIGMTEAGMITFWNRENRLFELKSA